MEICDLFQCGGKPWLSTIEILWLGITVIVMEIPQALLAGMYIAIYCKGILTENVLNFVTLDNRSTRKGILLEKL